MSKKYYNSYKKKNNNKNEKNDKIDYKNNKKIKNKITLKENIEKKELQNKEKIPTSNFNADDLIFALDIGTHSVIGMVGIKRDMKVEILEILEKSYPTRAMIDGQIQDIEMVAKISEEVKESLSHLLNIELKNVYVAAAGRTLKTVESVSNIVFDEPVFLDDDLITKINSRAIEEAEKKFIDTMNLSSKDDADSYYLSGYSITEYILDGYPMPTLLEHHGRVIDAKAIVTFLPKEVVESLYTTMTKIGLEVSGLTLEPIAAMNAAIPSNIRLLNLALVDIGAGTSDIAISRDGSVVGYTMVTVAGDEITECIMKKLLTDFETAEEIKVMMGNIKDDERIKYNDILSMEHEISFQELKECIEDAQSNLAKQISDAIMEVNGAVPSAVFLVGGGSRLNNFCPLIADTLKMDARRVALGGNNFEKTAFSSKYDIKNPAFATCLGIVVSAAFNMNNEGFFIRLNGKKCRLFRSGTITVFDILLMNGYQHRDLFARKGDSLSVTINGQKKKFFGEMSQPAIIEVNSKEAKVTTMLNAGDNVNFIPAIQGSDAKANLNDVIGDFKFDAFDVNVDGTLYKAGAFVWMDGKIIEKNIEMALYNNCIIKLANISTLEQLVDFYELKGNFEIEENDTHILTVNCKIHKIKSDISKREENQNLPNKNEKIVNDSENSEKNIDNKKNIDENLSDGNMNDHFIFNLNGKEIKLPARPKENPYILIDMLLHTGFNFDDPKSDVIIKVNGLEAGFTTELKNRDNISITWKNNK